MKIKHFRNTILLFLSILLYSCSIHSTMTKEFINRFKEGDPYLLDTNIFTQNCIKIKSDSLKFAKFQLKLDSLLDSNTGYEYFITEYSKKNPDFEEVKKRTDVFFNQKIGGWLVLEFYKSNGKWKINKYFIQPPVNNYEM